MKIGMVAPSLSRKGGGIYFSLLGVTRELPKLPEVCVKVFGLADDSFPAEVSSWSPVPVKAFPVSGPPAFGYAPRMSDALLHEDIQVLHSHGLWMYPSVAVSKWHRQSKRPYVVTPHGMLDAWALRNSRWKKQAAAFLFERKNLKNAACIHALCEAEAVSIREFGLSNPICVVPNGVDLPDLESEAVSGGKSNVRTVLYLGRLHRKKGLCSLISAWSQFRSRYGLDWRLVVAGWDQAGHEQELKDLAASLGASSTIDFAGPQFGKDKDRILRDCDAVILPSQSEGLPMVVLEAWSYAKPVLMTPACNLPEGFSRLAALQMEVSAESILAALVHLDSMSDTDREAMGRSGLQLVRDRFTWPEVARQLFSVYSWLAGKGERPANVI